VGQLSRPQRAVHARQLPLQRRHGGRLLLRQLQRPWAAAGDRLLREDGLVDGHVRGRRARAAAGQGGGEGVGRGGVLGRGRQVRAGPPPAAAAAAAERAQQRQVRRRRGKGGLLVLLLLPLRWPAAVVVVVVVAIVIAR
jgi:hypothetical protein